MLLLLFTAKVNSQPVDVAIIANPSVVSAELNASQLRSIFSMKQNTWPDGQPIKVYVLSSEHLTHQQFCKQVLRMFPYQVERIWNKLTYSGLGDLPIQVVNEQDMLAKVSQQPGAIGYVIGPQTNEGIHRIRLKTE